MRSIITAKSVLVTGGGGFIGANLVRKLLAMGCQVHLLWKKSTNPWRLQDIIKRLYIYEVALEDKSSLKSLCARILPSAIFHLAAYGNYHTQQDVDQMLKTNIEGTLNLLFVSKDIPYDIFVNTGSSAEYGIKQRSMRESDTLSPMTFYAAAKASATLLCSVFAKEFQKPVVTMRPFSVYGPYEEKIRFIPKAIVSALKTEDIQITGDDVWHDYIYVDDVIDAFLATWEKKNALVGKVVNVGTGMQHTNREIVAIILRLTESRSKIVTGGYPKRGWDSSCWVSDTTLSKNLLRWKAKHSLLQGLRKTITWMQANKPLYGL